MRLRVLRSEDDLPIVLVFIVLAALACLTPPQSDTWFHLRAGREMWESGALITHERFSHTAAGRPWQNHEWLSQLLLYGAYSAGGPILLTILTGAAAFAAVVWSWRLVRGPFELRLAMLLSLAFLTPTEWAVRPQALSLFVFMAAVHLVLRDRIGWLPPLIAVWANAHGVVVFGVIVAGVAAADALIWAREGRRRAIAIALLCAAAPMASPLGWHYWPRVVQTVSEARGLGIHEYRSAFELAAWPFWVMLLALAASVIARGVRLRDHERDTRLLVLTAAVLGVASITSIRNAPFFILVAAPALSRLLSGRSWRAQPRVAGRPAVAIVGIAAVVATTLVVYRWRDHGVHLGWQPVSPLAADAMRRCPGPIFNTYAEGGTLLWFVPEQPVFVDGRVEAYPLPLLARSRRADLDTEYQELFDYYGLRCAVVPTGSPMDNALRGDASMQKWFTDPQWSLFVASTP
jgi:hypothetical protein